MINPTKADSHLLISYLTLRKLIGILGFTFPLILLFGGLFLDNTIQTSISYYYHTSMHDIFVGILCIVAAFLLAYRGYERKDAIAGNIAGISAIGVAMIPTTLKDNPTEIQETLGYLHLVFATGYFSSIAYFCIFLFTKSDGKKVTQRKKQCNSIYRACGYTILVSLVMIILYTVTPDTITTPLAYLKPIFWLEAIAISAFGLAWLIKGEAILKEK